MTKQFVMSKFATVEDLEKAKEAHMTRMYQLYETGEIDEDYAMYIMKNGDPTEYVICNGKTLLAAMEDGYLLDEFLEQYRPLSA